MLMETIDFSKHKRVRLMVMQGQARSAAIRGSS